MVTIIDVTSEMAKLTMLGVTPLTVTPQPSEHVREDVADPRTVAVPP